MTLIERIKRLLGLAMLITGGLTVAAVALMGALDVAFPGLYFLLIAGAGSAAMGLVFLERLD